MASGYPRRAVRSRSRVAKEERSGTSAASAMDGPDERQGEGAGLDPGQIDGREAEPGVRYRFSHRLAEGFGHGPDEIVDGQLDAGDVAVVAYPQVLEAQSA